MILHIFKKDWKLLWHFFLVVALLQFIPAIIRLRLGIFGEDPALEYLLVPAVAVAMMGIGFVAVAIVHQDSIPDVSQDWLVRPIRRRDLLLAKLLFGVAILHGVIFAADLFLALASGFPLGQSLAGALSHNVYLVIILTLPALAIASVTRNMTQAIVAAGIAFCAGTGVEIAAVLAHGGKDYLYQTSGAGAAWIGRYCGQLMIVIGACVVLWLQYFLRRTSAARWLVATALLLFVLAQFLPWHLVFALQQRLSAKPNMGRTIALNFDPGLGRFRPPSGAIVSDSPSAQTILRDARTGVALPLSIVGLPSNAVLAVDKAEIRLLDSRGKVVFSSGGEDWKIHVEGTSDAQTTIYQKIGFPGEVYRRLEQQPLQMEIDYSLTLSGLDASYSLPATNGTLRETALGWCGTQMNEPGTFVELRCVQPGNSSTCRSVYLENAVTGLRNPTFFACDSEYEPSLERSNKDPMSHFGLNLPF